MVDPAGIRRFTPPPPNLEFSMYMLKVVNK